MALTTSTAVIAERYAYSAYGAPTVCNASGTDIGTSAKDNRITYTGREWDDDLVLYHFRARLYDAVVGRFLGRDIYFGSKASGLGPGSYYFWCVEGLCSGLLLGSKANETHLKALTFDGKSNGVRKVCCKYARGWVDYDEFAREISCPTSKTAYECCADHTNVWRWWTVLDSFDGPCECKKKLALVPSVMRTTVVTTGTRCDVRTRSILISTWLAIEICTWGDMDFPQDVDPYPQEYPRRCWDQFMKDSDLCDELFINGEIDEQGLGICLQWATDRLRQCTIDDGWPDPGDN